MDVAVSIKCEVYECVIKHTWTGRYFTSFDFAILPKFRGIQGLFPWRWKNDNRKYLLLNETLPIYRNSRQNPASANTVGTKPRGHSPQCGS